MIPYIIAIIIAFIIAVPIILSTIKAKKVSSNTEQIFFQEKGYTLVQPTSPDSEKWKNASETLLQTVSLWKFIPSSAMPGSFKLQLIGQKPENTFFIAYYITNNMPIVFYGLTVPISKQIPWFLFTTLHGKSEFLQRYHYQLPEINHLEMGNNESKIYGDNQSATMINDLVNKIMTDQELSKLISENELAFEVYNTNSLSVYTLKEIGIAANEIKLKNRLESLLSAAENLKNILNTYV